MIVGRSLPFKGNPHAPKVAGSSYVLDACTVADASPVSSGGAFTNNSAPTTTTASAASSKGGVRTMGMCRRCHSRVDHDDRAKWEAARGDGLESLTLAEQ